VLTPGYVSHSPDLSFALKLKAMKHSKKAKKSSSVPSEEDWGDYKADLDQKHAHSVFAGRTNAEMQPFFRRNPVEMTDELRWMPEVPFRFYMLGFRDFVMARNYGFLNASDAASCFLGLVLEKLEQHPQHIVAIMPDLLPALEYVGRNQASFQAEESIYGNFLEKLSNIKAMYAARSGS
jgi:hypothetical protein